MKYSSNQFAKAMATCDSPQQQAQAMEQVNVDVVDIVNQVMMLDDGFVKTPCNTIDDVKNLVAQAALRLRCVVAKLGEHQNLVEKIEDLEDQVEELKDKVYELEEELLGE